MRWTKGILIAVATGFALTALAANPEQGLTFYKEHEFDKAIEACEGGKDFMSRLVLGLSFKERYKIYKNRTDGEQAKIYLNVLEADVSMADAMTISRFLNVEGNAYGNEEAEDLLEEAFDNAKPTDVLLVAKFLNPDLGEDVNRLAARAIYEQLKPVRNYVSKGGTMPKREQELFVNPRLIEPLVQALEVERAERTARKCLYLIEAPSLKYLDAVKLTEPVSDAIVDVKKAIMKRQKRFPESNWYSAYGD